jgi:hypothetical protein
MPSKLSLNSQPYLYEINTWPWLEAISRTEGRAIDLGTVPTAIGMRLPILDRRRMADGSLAAQPRRHWDRTDQ